jgi:regulatory protein
VSDPAFAAALRILARRDHFRSELAEKLRRKELSDDEVEAAVLRCVEEGFVDDERVARRFVERRAIAKGWGPRRLRLELEKRGAPAEVAAAASEVDEESEGEALAVALEKAELRARAGWWRLHGARGRMVSSLVSRGFATGAAVRAVDRLAAEREITDDASDVQFRDPQDVP